MAFGPGKYDDVCTCVREMTNADSAIVIVVGGSRGSGFSVQASPEVVANLANLLRHMAQQVDESFGKS